MVIINSKEKQKKREVELLADESIIKRCNHTVYANCNKSINCYYHGEQTAKKVLIYVGEEKDSRKYLCPVCQKNIDYAGKNRDKQAKEKELNKQQEKFLNTGIGTRYIDVDVNNKNISIIYNQNVITKTLDIINILSCNKYIDIIIQGRLIKESENVNSKCGKTLLCALIIKSVLSERSNINIKYITYAELNSVIKSKSDSIINEYKKADILFIDDINCKYSEYSEQQFKDFLDYRYRNELSTVAVVETAEYSNLILNKLDNAEIIKLGEKDEI